MKMKSIWKYPLAFQDVQFVEMQKGAKILCVQTQNGQPCLWALVDPDAEKEERRIRIYGTGHPVAPNLEQPYIGTFQIAQGQLVFHVFESPD